MTEEELREKIGIGENDLVDSTRGLIDIMAVKGDRITYGFLATGVLESSTINEFIRRLE
jgi:hypothetical protein